TASGKTSFGIECARLFNGEIISGDSIQVYRGLDIGSAKATEEERKEVRHHLIDIKDPTESYSVKEFQDMGRELIESLSAGGKLPVVVGGTGLYIKALLYDYTFFEETEEDDPYEELTNEDIYDILKEEDPAALENIHVNNRKRLVRALNVLRKHNEGISEIKDKQKHEMLYDAKVIGLTLDREELYRRLEDRVDKMVEDGLVEEIDNLLGNGVSFDDQSMQAIGYKEFRGYFSGNRTVADCVEDIKKNTRRFAKRQYTWFNNQMPISWHTDTKEAIKEIEEWINTSKD
ncbi:MAG: tRNA (adenosine(37)-N6)-dimethylallyltransferase MiaA, partial [Erysipelotrichaceae bacterium]|nr:tRNA (adenosine(37)-N6)-dimethylallyltransferase MiaA [Erysipelotrichaceae bacterium]